MKPAKKLEEIVQALRVFGEHGLMQIGTTAGDIVATLVRLTPLNALLIKTALRCHIGLNADNRFDAFSLHLTIESIGAEHIAVVSNTDRWHALPGDLIRKQINLGHSVEHRILSVIVQMYE